MSVLFVLGDTSRDESVNFVDGPEFDLVSSSPDVFSFDAVSCYQYGIGLECLADVLFAPNAIGDFLSEFEIGALINFTETHGEEEGEIYEYSDAFWSSFRGTGIAPVPLPAAAAMFLAGLGLLGWLGRGKGAA
jgi:hypothetical protein